MAIGLACRACGVALPARVGRCPSCGGRSGLGGSRAWVGPVVVGVVAVLGLAMLGLLRRPSVDPALAKVVQAYPGLSQSAVVIDRGGFVTQMTGFIDNNGDVPVDVTVRFRALDIENKVVAEVVSGPHRRIEPGGSKRVPVTVNATPIAEWEMEIIRLAASPK